jgi:sugar-specific transcriptional regulator TrmB
VPYGKIYTVLESLARKGFIEVQVSRPKKLRAVDPEMSLNSFFEKRKTEFEKEILVLENSVEEAKQALKNVQTQKQKVEIFLTIAVTESEIRKFAISVYSEVKKVIIFNSSCLWHANNRQPAA